MPCQDTFILLHGHLLHIIKFWLYVNISQRMWHGGGKHLTSECGLSSHNKMN